MKKLKLGKALFLGINLSFVGLGTTPMIFHPHTTQKVSVAAPLVDVDVDAWFANVEVKFSGNDATGTLSVVNKGTSTAATPPTNTEIQYRTDFGRNGKWSNTVPNTLSNNQIVGIRLYATDTSVTLINNTIHKYVATGLVTPPKTPTDGAAFWASWDSASAKPTFKGSAGNGEIVMPTTPALPTGTKYIYSVGSSGQWVSALNNSLQNGDKISIKLALTDTTKYKWSNPSDGNIQKSFTVDGLTKDPVDSQVQLNDLVIKYTGQTGKGAMHMNHAFPPNDWTKWQFSTNGGKTWVDDQPTNLKNNENISIKLILTTDPNASLNTTLTNETAVKVFKVTGLTKAPGANIGLIVGLTVGITAGLIAVVLLGIFLGRWAEKKRVKDNQQFTNSIEHNEKNIVWDDNYDPDAEVSPHDSTHKEQEYEPHETHIDVKRTSVGVEDDAKEEDKI